MAQKRKGLSGLVKRGGVWHIDKTIRGCRICESTGSGDIQEAERYLAHRLEGIRKTEIYGEKRTHSFREASLKYVKEASKKTLWQDVVQIKHLDPYIGQLPLEQIHMGTLQKFIEDRRRQGVKARTINCGIQVVRRILNLASGEWFDDNGEPWLFRSPKIRFVSETDKRDPYPLSWDEQARLFNALPQYLRKMALFAVNTGLRNGELCGLRWEWEEAVPELGISIFIIPGQRIKNGQDRVVVLNSVAKEIIEEMRKVHPKYVFSLRGKPVSSMYGRAWKAARESVGLNQVRIHDLRHTFGRRLRAAGVSFEDRQDLLGHKSGRMTTHYSMPELSNLIASANTVCGDESRKSPALVVLKKKSIRAATG